MIPVSIVIVTKNEAAHIGACLDACARFEDIWVVDSFSEDGTREIAIDRGARVHDFSWNGQYPKIRQWCLEHLELAHDFVFFVDADEIVTPALVDEIAGLDFSSSEIAGYFVSGQYVYRDQRLRFGLRNNKIALLDRRKIEFPVVDDLDIEGMGELEGHYQPVLRSEYAGANIGVLKGSLLHYAHESDDAWEARHKRYARWEAAMNAKGAWPEDPVTWRQGLKRVFRALPFRGVIAFLHSYVLKLGVLDGAAGFSFAISRARYYVMISKASREMARTA